jgi:hypothetical protein
MLAPGVVFKFYTVVIYIFFRVVDKYLTKLCQRISINQTVNLTASNVIRCRSYGCPVPGKCRVYVDRTVLLYFTFTSDRLFETCGGSDVAFTRPCVQLHELITKR